MELAFTPDAGLLSRLRARYEESHRHYHTWSHVLACFESRDRLEAPPDVAVDLALLFHDAIYEPLAKDNERRSADLLVEEGRSMHLSEDVLARAAELVLVTRHDAPHENSDQAGIVLDADLSILGADDATFEQYERDVRREFAIVSQDLYRAGRAGVLAGFLDRPSIFVTAKGKSLWESRARKNLTRSLALLGQ